MYKIENVVYLSEEENKELLADELDLTKINHVDKIEDVPEDYSFKYEVGKDIAIF